MRLRDTLLFSFEALRRQRFRSAMVIIAVAVGVASVLILTTLGEGARSYVLGEFEALGKNVLIVLPGKKETTGGLPPLMGTAARDLTLADAEGLKKRISAITAIAPIILGSTDVAHQQLSREVVVLGSSADFLSVRNMSLSQGRNLRAGNTQTTVYECLLGETLKKALFGNQSAVGQWVRVGEYRLRVVGILKGRGDSFGIDLSDAAIVPVALAQQLYNVEGLFRLLLQLKPNSPVDQVRQRIIAVMKKQHQGEEDVTVISPDAILNTFNDVLLALTLGVGAIGAVSLVVAGILIMNITLINVSQRTREIGLLKALGANAQSVQILFLTETTLLTVIGIALGLALGQIAVIAGNTWFPEVPFSTPLWALISGPLSAIVIGLLFAWYPCRRASALPPVEAMQCP